MPNAFVAATKKSAMSIFDYDNAVRSLGLCFVDRLALTVGQFNGTYFAGASRRIKAHVAAFKLAEHKQCLNRVALVVSVDVPVSIEVCCDRNFDESGWAKSKLGTCLKHVSGLLWIQRLELGPHEIEVLLDVREQLGAMLGEIAVVFVSVRRVDAADLRALLASGVGESKLHLTLRMHRLSCILAEEFFGQC